MTKQYCTEDQIYFKALAPKVSDTCTVSSKSSQMSSVFLQAPGDQYQIVECCHRILHSGELRE